MLATLTRRFALILCTLVLMTASGAAVAPALASTSGRNFSIDRVDVDITVNADTSQDVREYREYTYNGSYNGFRRDITLQDYAAEKRCVQDSSLQCGGFTLLKVIYFKVNGRELNASEYRLLPMSDSGSRYLRVEYEFPGAPLQLNNTEYTFDLKYQVLGAIGQDQTAYDLFYWDMHTADRDVPVKQSKMTINFPGAVRFTDNTANVFAEAGLDYTYNTSSRAGGGTVITLETSNIPAGIPFTYLQQIPKGQLQKAADLALKVDPSNAVIKLGSYILPTDMRDNKGIYDLQNLPPGSYALEASADLYEPMSKTVVLAAGTTVAEEINLQLSPTGQFLFAAVVLVNLCCCGLALLAPFFVYWLWRRNGRDPQSGKAIAVELNPPADIKAYLAGILWDERVNNHDVSAMMIDLARRGHMHIAVGDKPLFGSREYTFSKLENQKDSIDNFEQKLLDALFNDGETVTLSALRYKFYADYQTLSSDLYEETLTRKWFVANPETTRRRYLGLGVATLTIGLSLGVLAFTIFLFTPILFAFSLGIPLIIVAFAMPKRTSTGAEMHRQLAGFQMYLNTAERYTIQNLTPENFEAYLPYAMVFGIEKQWAEKFQDIYTANPSWFSTTDNSFNTLIFASMISDFNHATASTLAVAPSSSSSSGGSGWSGGGGFGGGFSGGGGGGGGEGGW